MAARALEAKQPVAAEPAKVWPLLIEPRSWNRWWPAVRDARSLDFKPLHEGSRFELTLQQGRHVSTLRPRVALCAEGKSLAWEGRWLGVPLRQEWFLEPRPGGCRVIARSRFFGAGAWLLGLLRLDRRWERMLVEAVRGLKRVAEQL